MLSESISTFLFIRNYKVLKVIFSNTRKKRYVLLVSKDKEENIIKRDETPELLIEERNFYKRSPFSFLPNLIDTGQNYLIMQYYHYPTLREKLKNYTVKWSILDEEFRVIIDSYSSLIWELIQHSTIEKNRSATPYKTFKKYLSKLTLSWPSGTKSNRSTLYIRIIFNTLHLLYFYIFTKICSIDLARRWTVHWDLHLNNILLSWYNLIVIDREDNHKNSILVDICYSYSMILNLLINLPSQKIYLQEKISSILWPELNTEFTKLLPFFLRAVSMNKRFS